eukprot:TRINITY_DN16250_c0_g1_i2.p1 TRINITY_DN16250_c0_g1~~TRINITY_DN16250_c0_g1_i2.p1  ORF type:complete len:154 (-),score=44.76 TRINITY_DN16250_c0_g1_i2:100-561(-)
MFHEIFPSEDLIYLSPDSENILIELDHTKVYVIGGLVDHNQLKGLSLRRAREQGISTARLPICEVLCDRANTSLNQNHVYQILDELAATSNMKETFLKYTPTRKGFRKIKTNLPPPLQLEYQGIQPVTWKADDLGDGDCGSGDGTGSGESGVR